MVVPERELIILESAQRSQAVCDDRMRLPQTIFDFILPTSESIELIMKKSTKPPRSTAEDVARAYYRQTAANRSELPPRFLFAGLLCALLVPAIFYLRFGEVDGLGWGLTIFLTLFCWLSALGLYFLPRSEYHTPVELRNDRWDRIGAFWLVSCAFGPLCVWLLNAIVVLTPSNWRWIYLVEISLTIGLPLLTALPLFRYVRGKAALIALPILIGVTLLPIWVGLGPLMDVVTGPSATPTVLILRYTSKELPFDAK
jgi:hypothetical protein